MAALKKAQGVFMPSASQDPNGAVTVNLGAKGIIECELVSSAASAGAAVPRSDIHSSNKAMVDCPVWHLVDALRHAGHADGNTPTIDGWFENVAPLSARERALIAKNAAQAQRSRLKSNATASSASSTICPGARRWSGWPRSRP